MKLFYSLSLFAVVALMTANTALADSNASDTTVILNSETVDLTAFTFDHWGVAGFDDGTNQNSTASATFVGGFQANQLRFAGTTTAVAAGTWASESDILVTGPVVPPNLDGEQFTWQNPGPSATYTSLDFDSAQDITTTLGDAFNSGGTFDLEFFESFDDDAASIDSQTTNLTMTFQEVGGGVFDENGQFTLGSLSVGDEASSVGEFALSELFDIYDVTLAEDGLLTVQTSADPGGFTGSDADTEIAIFDSNGVLIAENDDSDSIPDDGFYSLLEDISLAAGDYQIAVASFNSVFADGPTVTPGVGTGDYSLTVSLSNAIPEPTSALLLGFACCGLALRRRK